MSHPRPPHVKPKQNKRIEVVGDDGWTRVTTTNQNKRAPKPSTLRVKDPLKTTPEPRISPEKVKLAYNEREKEWLASDSCKVLVQLVEERLQARAFHVDTCIIFGSASFCGHWQGWRERKNVAFIQLAILKTIQKTIESVTKQPVKAYAQDPAYNEVDIEFLQLVDVTEISDPDGFALIGPKSLVYTPNAELFVEMEVLRRKPGVLLTAKLDWYWRNKRGQAYTSRVRPVVEMAIADEGEGQQTLVQDQKEDTTAENERLEEECQAYEAFLAIKQTAALPRLDHKDEPFYNQYLYWPSGSDEAEDQDPS